MTPAQQHSDGVDECPGLLHCELRQPSVDVSGIELRQGACHGRAFRAVRGRIGRRRRPLARTTREYRRLVWHPLEASERYDGGAG